MDLLIIQYVYFSLCERMPPKKSFIFLTLSFISLSFME